MSRAKRGQRSDDPRPPTPTDAPLAAPATAPQPHEPAPDDAEAQALSAFFRELATRAERDPAFGAGLLSVAQASGLAQLTGADEGEAPTTTQPKGKRSRQPRAAANAPAGSAPAGSAPAASVPAEATPQPAPDPFAVMRAQGEAGLRATLDALDLDALRQIVRAHRLDPARISARWANHDRVIALIVDQTRARLNHGRAFERV